jgi:hypothetical protein
LIPATLINWLAEWTKRQFKEYLKTNIHSLYVSSRTPQQCVQDKAEKGEEKEEKVSDPFMVINQKSMLYRKRRSVEEKKEVREVPKYL